MADKKKRAFVIYDDWKPLFESLPDDKAGELIKAIMRFHADGVVTVSADSTLNAVFNMITARIANDDENYKAKCNKNRLNRMKALTDNNDNKQSSTNVNERQHKDKDKDKDKEKDKDINTISSVKPTSERINYQSVVDDYNTICVDLPKVREITDKRKTAIRSMVKNGYTPDKFHELFETAQKSDFLTGRSGKWKAGFDWLMNRNNAVKVLEGNYKNKDTPESGTDYLINLITGGDDNDGEGNSEDSVYDPFNIRGIE